MPIFGRPSEQDQRTAQAWRDWLGRQNLLAVVSVVFSVVSLVEFGVLLVFGLVGIVLGVMAIIQLRRPDPASGRTGGRGLAILGISLSLLSLLLASALYTGGWGLLRHNRSP